MVKNGNSTLLNPDIPFWVNLISTEFDRGEQTSTIEATAHDCGLVFSSWLPVNNSQTTYGYMSQNTELNKMALKDVE